MPYMSSPNLAVIETTIAHNYYRMGPNFLLRGWPNVITAQIIRHMNAEIQHSRNLGMKKRCVNTVMI